MFPDSHPEPVLTFANVTAGYQRSDSPIFKGVSVTLQGPQLIHLVGRNGSGKSTFVELVSGYLHPFAGEIVLGAARVGDPTTRALRRVCRSRPALFGSMTGRDHVNLACLARNESRAEAFERADGLALTPWLDEQARTLSSGNVKKLWYLICTLGAASLFVLDEPFDAVDQEGVEQMCLDITRWSTSALVILTSHHLPAQVADARQLLISSFAPSDHDSETVAQ